MLIIFYKFLLLLLSRQIILSLIVTIFFRKLKKKFHFINFLFQFSNFELKITQIKITKIILIIQNYQF